MEYIVLSGLHWYSSPGSSTHICHVRWGILSSIIRFQGVTPFLLGCTLHWFIVLVAKKIRYSRYFVKCFVLRPRYWNLHFNKIVLLSLYKNRLYFKLKVYFTVVPTIYWSLNNIIYLMMIAYNTYINQYDNLQYTWYSNTFRLLIYCMILLLVYG